MLSEQRDTVLFVSPGPSIVNPSSGEGARLRNLSCHLADRWEVLALVPADAHQSRTEWIDEVFTYRQWSIPFLTDLNPMFVRVLGKVVRTRNVDIVHLSHGVCTATGIARTLGSNTSVVYAAQNVEANHARDFVDENLPVYKRALGPRLIPRIESWTVRCADGVTTVSDADRQTFLDRYDLSEDRIRTIPTGTTTIDDAQLRPASEVRAEYGLTADHVAVFHGSYDHPPNREAAELIDEYVAPQIRSRGLDVQFLLVGSDPPSVEDPAIRTTGFVEDLFSVLNVADLAVVPIRHGGGTKTKVYDYISLGLPIVTHS